MTVVLWLAQILLALAFAVHAYLMLQPPRERLEQGGMRYILELPAGLRWFAGMAEGLGAIALVVAPFLGALAWLTPLAAMGLVLIMVGSIAFHVTRREYPTSCSTGFWAPSPHW